MLQEVFELMMQVHAGMNIVAVGTIDGTRIQAEVVNDGNRETRVTLDLISTDIGFATFKKHSVSSYIYNDQVTGQTEFENEISIPYANISYMEFTNDEL